MCVAGGIKTVEDAKQILENGADKISINSPALNNPNLIKELSDRFGKQCVVVGIDSYACNGDYYVYKYTGDSTKTQATGLKTLD
ncbi:hypothetical protein FACS189459_3510 [Bacilli bacterium]|nr:hypothetical protein FACS189459_3510 [Bacilli bacterium]